MTDEKAEESCNGTGSNQPGQDASDNLIDDLFLEIENIDLFNANKVAGLIKAKLENKQNRQRSIDT